MTSESLKTQGKSIKRCGIDGKSLAEMLDLTCPQLLCERMGSSPPAQ